MIYNASQADVAVFKALKEAPSADKYPAAARWYKHIATYEDEFATLEGDASKPYTVYGPDESELTVNPAKAPAAAADDDDVDLFGSDDEEEDAEAARIREERLAAYREKKAAKPKVAAKSVVTLDVKPWGEFDSYRFPLLILLLLAQSLRLSLTHALMLTLQLLDDETDLVAMEAAVRAIEKDGLLWGASKLVPVGFGIKKLQINLVVEDEKVSLDELQEQIQEIEDYVQSSDIVAMQKL
ncbi:hypothetical protein MKX07_003888 [Trichoderma sp. CBMAI-0711]|nr:hypothetical protein MKX07_003888 [Trichoderma sp. CBMAI-0711]